jgi:hypothetical protein
MAIRRIRVDYTVYPPNFQPGRDVCWDFMTVTKAKARARQLGPGSRVYRNYNQTNKRGKPLGNWWGGKAYVWTGDAFERIFKDPNLPLNAKDAE